MKHYPYLIIGGGAAAAYAAREFADCGVRPGEVAIISSDKVAPYYRPALSKTFLKGEKQLQDIYIKEPAFYREAGIDLLLDTRAAKLNTRDRQVETANGESFGFDRLLLATGSRPRTLDLEGGPFANLYYLRNQHDALVLRRAGRLADRLVAIGGGFIGLEATASLAGQLRDTSIVFNDDHIMSRVFTPVIAEFFSQVYARKGVRLYPSESVEEIRGHGMAHSVRLQSRRTLKADMILAAIGAVPALDFVEDSALRGKEGIPVNQWLESKVPGIYAAGDIAEYPDARTGRTMRVEHWSNAMQQGKTAARNMFGEAVPYEETPFFFSDMFDLSWQFWGDPADFDDVVYHGDMDDRSFSAWWIKDSDVVAAMAVNVDRETRKAAREAATEHQRLPNWVRNTAGV